MTESHSKTLQNVEYVRFYVLNETNNIFFAAFDGFGVFLD